MTSAKKLVPAPAWGHASGLLKIGRDAVLEPEQLADRLAIIDRMYRYAWSFDERQLEMLTDCFAKDATWEAHLTGTSTIGPFVGRVVVVAFMSSCWADQLVQRRHLIMNAVVEDQSADEATLLTYHLLVSTTKDTGVVPVTTGFYRVRMNKSAKGHWRIHSLIAGYDVPF